MKRLLALVFLVLAFAGATYYWSQQRAELSHGQIATLADESKTTDSGEEAVTAEAVEEEIIIPNGMAPAKRVLHGEVQGSSVAAGDSESTDLSLEKRIEFSRQVDRALGGDTDALVETALAIRACLREPGNLEELQKRLDRMAESRTRSSRPAVFTGFNPDGSLWSTDSLKEAEDAMWEQFETCQLQHGVLTEDFKERIDLLAERGDSSARYLYAMWPPRPDLENPVNSLELFEYQTRSLDYTWLNMEERNPLGVLAMAQSYGSSFGIMFTPRNGQQGHVFTLAAQACGLEHDFLQRSAENFVKRIQHWQTEDRNLPESMAAQALALAELYCPEKID